MATLVIKMKPARMHYATLITGTIYGVLTDEVMVNIFYNKVMLVMSGMLCCS